MLTYFAQQTVLSVFIALYALSLLDDLKFLSSAWCWQCERGAAAALSAGAHQPSPACTGASAVNTRPSTQAFPPAELCHLLIYPCSKFSLVFAFFYNFFLSSLCGLASSSRAVRSSNPAVSPPASDINQQGTLTGSLRPVRGRKDE